MKIIKRVMLLSALIMAFANVAQAGISKNEGITRL